jgi:hypothetical protein
MSEKRALGLVALLVRDYDEALAFFVGVLGFVLVEDTDIPAQMVRQRRTCRPTPSLQARMRFSIGESHTENSLAVACWNSERQSPSKQRSNSRSLAKRGDFYVKTTDGLLGRDCSACSGQYRDRSPDAAA